jgi:hypothetical protein
MENIRLISYGRIIGSIAGLLLATASVQAGGLPSSKVAIVQGDLFGLGVEACKLAGPNPGDCATGVATDDSGYITVMQSFIKTPNGKELAFDAALQCGLITFTEAKVKSKGGGGSSAEGRIQVRVKVTPVDNDGVATGEPVEYALPNNDGANDINGGPASGDAGPQGVTYCNRFQELALSYDNLVCLFDSTGTPGDECEIAVSLLQKTLNAHAFNFVLPNTSSGIKRIEVQARATADAAVFAGDTLSSARGEAFIGMGSTRITTVRAVKSFDENTGVLPTIEELQ